MRFPVIGLAVCFGFGILAGTVFDFHLAVPYSILIAAFIISCIFINRNSSCIPICLCSFLIGVIVVPVNLTDPLHVVNLVPERGTKKLDLEGVVISEPEEDSLLMQVDAVFEKDERGICRGVVLLRLNRGEITCGYGDKIRVDNGYLSLPSSPRNPGGFDYRSFLLRRKIYVLADVFSPGCIVVLGEKCGNPVIRLALLLKSRMETIIEKSMDPPQSLFLEAMLLGNRRKLPEEWKEVFSSTGTAHILSISGLHVGFVFSIALILFGVLNLPVKMSSMLTVIIIIAYCLVTGSRPPAIRASIMAIMILTGRMLDRPVNNWNSLALAAFIILALNPMELFNPGFQMSFVAVFGILYLCPRIQRLLHPSHSWLKWIWRSTTVIAGAQIAVLPLIAYYFNVLPLISFPANFVVVPMLAIIVGLGFSACILGLIWIGFAHLFNAANWVAITGLLKTSEFLYRLPGSYVRIQSPPVYFIIVYYLCIFLLAKILEGISLKSDV